MKKRCFFIVSAFIAIAAQAQIPNADMENWTFAPNLIDWETNSYPLTLPPYDPYIVKKDSDSYSGNWSADLHGNGVFKPYAKTTFAVQQHPHHLSLYYKLTFPPCVNDTGYGVNDTVSVTVELLKQGVVVDNGYWESTSNQFNYTQLNVPFSQSASMFDSCRITFWGGEVRGGCGFTVASTEFLIDHLELKYSAVDACVDSSAICDTCSCFTVYNPVCGCNNVTYSNSCYAHNAGVTNWTSGACTLTQENRISETIQSFITYPVPAKSSINISYTLSENANCTITITNLLGQSVVHRTKAETVGKHDEEIDVTSLLPGIYFLTLNTGNQQATGKFIKE